jgi:hypothetical protein
MAADPLGSVRVTGHIRPTVATSCPGLRRRRPPHPSAWQPAMRAGGACRHRGERPCCPTTCPSWTSRSGGRLACVASRPSGIPSGRALPVSWLCVAARGQELASAIDAAQPPPVTASPASEHVGTLRGLYHCACSRQRPLVSVTPTGRNACSTKVFRSLRWPGSSGREKSSRSGQPERMNWINASHSATSSRSRSVRSSPCLIGRRNVRDGNRIRLSISRPTCSISRPTSAIGSTWTPTPASSPANR